MRRRAESTNQNAPLKFAGGNQQVGSEDNESRIESRENQLQFRYRDLDVETSQFASRNDTGALGDEHNTYRSTDAWNAATVGSV